MKSPPLPPRSVIGILGGGQLGRMLALAAAPLGYRCHIYCPDDDAPAAQVSERATIAAYDDFEALERFAASVDVVTYEFENVPAATAEFVDRRVRLSPSPFVLATCQDRIREKTFLNSIGIPTTGWEVVRDADDLDRKLRARQRPGILKAARYGYDGKAQAAIDGDCDAAAIWAATVGGEGEADAILEDRVSFAKEVSVILARNGAGELAAYPAVENVHENHILRRTVAPAVVSPALAASAERMGREIAVALDLIGVVAVEMFVTGDDRLLVNELAPRPHNSGHWTIDACITSQFEQCVRAICGLPLGATDRFAAAVMDNLLGDEIDGAFAHLAEPFTKVHVYGKAEARPGRKMGHLTRLRFHNLPVEAVKSRQQPPQTE